MLRSRILVFCAVLFCAFGANAFAQEAAQRELKVATRVLSPMVIERGGELTGFSIDIWNEVAARLKVKTIFSIAPDVRAQLEAVRAGEADLAVAAISITSAREAEFDFSQPMMNAGLQIMVRGEGKDGDSSPLKDMLGLLFSSTSLVWVEIALLLILVPAHIIWFLERGHPHGIIPTRNYIPGIFFALYWAAGTLATQAEAAPRQWLARVMALIWMFASLVFVALYTAQLTATLTVQQITGGINGPDDLAGRRIAATRGSTAATIAERYRADVHEVGQIDEAFAALHARKVDAIVFDSPVLLYYAMNEGKGRVTTIGAPFRKEDYGIAFRRSNPLVPQVNVALLQMREDGTYQKIYEKWFGTK